MDCIQNQKTCNTKMLNKIGPRIEPCCTPHEIFFHKTFVIYLWFDKWSRIRFKDGSSTSYTWNLTVKVMIDLLLTFSWPMFLSHRNQSVELLCELADWFLSDGNIGRLKVKKLIALFLSTASFHRSRKIMFWFSIKEN